MTGFSFQEEGDGPPVVFNDQGEIFSGRPDAARIVGFADPLQRYRVTVVPALVSPGALVGLTAVMIDREGGEFGTGLKIIEAHDFFGDPEKETEVGNKMVKTHEANLQAEVEAIPPMHDGEAFRAWAEGKTNADSVAVELPPVEGQ